VRLAWRKTFRDRISVFDMRIDPDACRDPDLLAAEVRRLQGVIAAGEATLTDEEREVLGRVAEDAACRAMQWTEKVVRGLLERLQ
jgi:hypothetical protein